MAGAKYHLRKNTDFDIAIDLQARRRINPKVSAKTATTSTEIDLEESWGYQLSLPMMVKMRAPYRLTIEPFLTRWELDQASDSGGDLLPENETDILGVNFILSC